MTLDDITDENPTARKMRIAAKKGKLSDRVKELTKGKSEDRRNSANYNSGVGLNDVDDGHMADTGMGGGEDFSS